MGGDLSYRELLSLNKDTKIHHRRTLGRLGSDSISEKPIRLESRKTLYYNFFRFFSFTGDVKRVIIFSAGKTTDRQEEIDDLLSVIMLYWRPTRPICHAIWFPEKEEEDKSEAH